jgi:hypothetical protein
MNVRVLAGSIALALASSVAGAQGAISPQCPPGGTVGPAPDATRATQDACQVAVDVFQYMAPQLALALSGGNATLGQGGTLGGIGHFSVGLRVNALNGSLPQVQDVRFATTGALSRSIETEGQIIGMPTVDAAVGVFQGIPLGVTNVGGVDLLLSAAYIPDISADGVDLSTDSPLKLGFGARVGLLQESLIVPGVSLTFLRRQLPTVDITASADVGALATQEDSIYVRNVGLNSNSWRLVASKSFLAFGLAAGIGQDRFDATTDVEAAIQPRPPVFLQTQRRTVEMKQEMTRTNMFLDVSMNLPFIKFVAEIGQSSGGSVAESFNQFSGKAADASRIYGSLGVRFGF